MNQLLANVGTSADFGLNWPTWIAAVGFGLFCLLGFYATLLLVGGKHLPARFRFLQLPSLRGRMLLGFILAATLPAISLALVLTERTTNERLEATATILQSQAQTVAGLADFFMQRYVTELSNAARAIRVSDDAAGTSIEQRMLQSHKMMTGITVMLASDATGKVIATTRKHNGAFEVTQDHVRTTLNESYFRAPFETGEPYISNGLRDPHGNYPLSAAISVPIHSTDGAIDGVLMGFYDLSGLSRAQSPLAEKNGIRSVMLDRDDLVMYASVNSDIAAEEDLSIPALLPDGVTAPGQIFNFNLESPDTGKTSRYLATTAKMRSGWQLLLYRPLDEIEAALLSEYGVALAWLLGALLISISLALALVHSLSGPLESLDESVRNFDLNIKQEIAPPPPDAPREVLTIFEHLGSLDTRLRAIYQKLRKAVQQGEKLRGELIYEIANREKAIEQRTEELKEANQTLERLSREDSLTGLANRRWFAEFLARAWQGALRDKTPLSILILDIDNFKAYNDNYGHQKGDTCLKLVAEAIRRAVGRASDLVSRYGGEEFIVVLGDTPLEGGLRIAERIRAAVENLGIPHKGALAHQCVTVSIGVTSTLPSLETQPETVLVAADRAMYNAKNDGKNQVAYSTAARTGTYQALCIPKDADTLLS